MSVDRSSQIVALIGRDRGESCNRRRPATMAITAAPSVIAVRRQDDLPIDARELVRHLAAP
jgi:hypothetical protein